MGMATAKNNGSSALRERRKAEYDRGPKCCKHCGTPLSYDERHKDFCDASCAASFNNTRRKQVVTRQCKECGEEFVLRTPSEKRIFCSSVCSGAHRRRKTIEAWLSTGSLPISVSGQPVARSIKEYLLEEQNGRCAICGGAAVHNAKPLVFVLDHIDGDSTHNDRSNLRLICPNCDSQTDTYKARNKGKGRRSRGFSANAGL